MKATQQLVIRWIPVVVGVIAAGLAAYPLTLPSMLAGVHGYGNGQGYDDGVYLGSALRLVHGSLPYRDYTFVHPPGIALLLSPIAAIGRLVGSRDALVMARLATVLVAGLNAGLVAWAVRHRGWVASLSAGLLLACFPSAYAADHTLLLEPWLVLFCLLALVTAFPDGHVTGSRRRLLVAGLLAGVAGTVKVWAILPVLALVLVVVIVRRRRSGPLLAGVALGFLVPCLPFFLAAPHAFVQDVLVAQLARSTSGARLDASSRLGVMSGLKHFGEPASSLPVVALAIAAALTVTLALVLGRRRLKAAEAAIACAAGLIVVGLFVPVQLYDHYAYFSAPFFALLVGTGAGLAASRLQRVQAPWARWAPALVALVVVLAVGFSLPQGIGRARSYFSEATDPAAAVRQFVPAGSCVISDDPSLLVAADRFSAARSGCPQVDDPFGMWLTDADGSLPHVGGPFPDAFVEKWSGWMGQSDYVVLSIQGSSYLPFSPGLFEQFGYQFVQVGTGEHVFVYKRIH